MNKQIVTAKNELTEDAHSHSPCSPGSAADPSAVSSQARWVLMSEGHRQVVGILLALVCTLVGGWICIYAIMIGGFVDVDERPTIEPEYVVDINHASHAELANLPGIGDKIADEIIRYRQANGPFLFLRQLQDVDGIGEVKYRVLLPYLKPIDRNGKQATLPPTKRSP